MLLRTGVVLEKSRRRAAADDAAVPLLRRRPASAHGRQYISWIHRLDVVEMIRWIIETPAVIGPVNATAPHPVTNREFARALGRALRRPSFVPGAAPSR